MANRFSDALAQVKRSGKRDQSRMLHDTAYRMSRETISINDAMLVLQLFFLEYEEARHLKAAQYCIMEAQRLLQAKKIPYYRALYPTIDFHTGIDQELVLFFQKKRDLFSKLKENYLIRWSWLASLISLLFLGLLSLLLHLNFFLSFLLALLLWLFLQAYGTRVLAVNYAQSMLARYYPALHSVHQGLVKSWHIRQARLLWLVTEQNFGIKLPFRAGKKA